MKILIVYGDGVIFRALAQKLYRAIKDVHNVDVAVENFHQSPWRVLRDRIRRQGLIRGLDQFLFKIFDLLILRRRLVSRLRGVIDNQLHVHSINGLNSLKGINFLRSKKYDVVICLATSILGKEVLSIPAHGFLNIHPGVLPAYRGTGNFWAVVNQDWFNIGCTIHWMNEKIDSGKVVAITRLRHAPAQLWRLHFVSMAQGIYALAAVIRDNRLLTTSIDTPCVRARYYGWYGFIDYIHFRRSMAQKKIDEV